VNWSRWPYQGPQPISTSPAPFVPNLGSTCPPVPPQPWGAPPVLHYGSQGPWVAYLRAHLCLSVTPWFDKATHDKVALVQSAAGLVPDGVVGPATWKALGVL
jgi:hypothetical protein